jgi:hypothetical protein
MLTGRIWFDGPETKYVDPTVEARHDRYDEDGIHGVVVAAPSTNVPTGAAVQVLHHTPFPPLCISPASRYRVASLETIGEGL